MADEYGKIYKRIWGDPDFKALDGAAQLMYLKLLSQPDISLAGVLTLATDRWAKQTGRLSPSNVDKTLHTLETKGFIIIDQDTSEVLVRSYIRQDKLWKSAKSMKGVVGAVGRVLSQALRTAISYEVSRIDTSEVTEQTQSGFRPRDAVDALIADLMRDSPIPTPDTLSDGVSHGVSHTLSDGVSRVGPKATANANATATANARGTSEGVSPTPAKNGTRIKPDWMPTPEVIDTIRAEHPHLDLNTEHQDFIDYWLAAPGQKGVKLDWDATWRRWMRKNGKEQTQRAAPRPDRATQTYLADAARYSAQENSEGVIQLAIGQ